jgi:hypothetical protein
LKKEGRKEGRGEKKEIKNESRWAPPTCRRQQTRMIISREEREDFRQKTAERKVTPNF